MGAPRRGSSRGARLVALAAAVVAAALVTVFVVGVLRVRAAPPVPRVDLQAPPSLAVATAGAAPPPRFMPVRGSLALAVSGPRVDAGPDPLLTAVDAAAPHPIASVAKALTALVVLDAHPMAPGTEGAQYRISAADVTLYREALAAGGSVVPVSEGELFTERQLLLALMLPSGNNIADTLARWAGGDLPGFLVRANAKAAALGMAATRMVDASGFESGTVASAADLVALARAVLASPVLAAVVATRSATLPDGSTVENLDTPLADAPGWLGIKTGNSDDAGGCLLFAARRVPEGDTDAEDAVTVVGAVLGQRGPGAAPTGADDRGAAIDAARKAVGTALASLHPLEVGTLQPTVSGTVSAPWGPSQGVALGQGAAGRRVVVSSGVTLALRVAAASPAAPLAAGAEVGSLEATVGPDVVARWPVVVSGAVPEPDWSWRLLHG